MRISTHIISALLMCSTSCASLPFGSKLSKMSDEEETASVRGAASKVSNSQEGFETSPTVESFFQTSQDTEGSDSLQDTLHKMSNTDEMHEFLLSTRRSLHRKPELMYDLPVTSNTIQTILEELDISFTSGWAKNTHEEAFKGKGGHGVVAHVGTNDPDQPCIILRADMDALPIMEATTGIDTYKSSNPGQMHACGHDGHVTMLLGAAALLKKVEKEIEGTIRFVFQPAEEGGAGMKRMVEEGVIDLAPKAQYGFGMHVWPTLPTGAIASKPGPLLAAAEMFEIVLDGKGGHAAMPHLTIDPIVAASSLVLNLQSIVSRTISPLESGVVSVTQISAGDAFNVIPASTLVRGTIRALSTEMLMSLRDKVSHMTSTTASLHGCNSTIQFSPDFYPPTVNDEELFEWSKGIGEIVSREGIMRDIVPTMGGEDFAFLAEKIPTTFFLLGQGSGGDEKYHMPRTDFGLHHPSFAMDEEVLPIGVELHANLAIRSLKKLAQESEEATQAEL